MKSVKQSVMLRDIFVQCKMFGQTKNGNSEERRAIARIIYNIHYTYVRKKMGWKSRTEQEKQRRKKTHKN